MTRKYTSLKFIEKPVANGNFSTTGRLTIKNVVIHTTQGYLGGTLSWFNNPKSGVSSNYLLDKDGTIYAMLEEYYVPYTNGNLVSNQQSITIEVVDDGNPNIARSDALYAVLASLTRDICTYYGLPINRTVVKGHREVSSSHPQCPGNIDVDRIVKQANPTVSDKEKIEKVTALVKGTGEVAKWKIREALGIGL